VILTRLEFRGDAEVGAEEAAPEFGNQFLARALGLIFGVAAEVAVEALRSRRPVNKFMAQHGRVRRGVAKRSVGRHLHMIARGRIEGFAAAMPDDGAGVGEELLGLRDAFVPLLHRSHGGVKSVG